MLSMSSELGHRPRSRSTESFAIPNPVYIISADMIKPIIPSRGKETNLSN